jgi:NAD+ diphosphatase
LVYATAAELGDDLSRADAVFLGLRGEQALFACDVQGGAAKRWRGEAEFLELRTVATRLSAEESGVAAQARSLLDWHKRSRFCSACGRETTAGPGGNVRRCPPEGCGTEHFPRIDVVVITLVSAGDRCLLGRQPRFAPGLYSAFAGFVEAGETLEAAARREVWEESGIELTSLQYAFSQPWPFPCTLTLALIGTAAAGGGRAGSEISEVRWFEVEQLRGMLRVADTGDTSAAFRVPGPMTLGNQLVRRWLEEFDARSSRG